MSYAIKLPQFEGPFDLLLFFIERDELDIYDIPISKITDDFLAYITELQSLNIELASEFILVAATLMRIKAKMLLPRKELDEAGEEIDPRLELVDQLIEYKKYKQVLNDFKTLEESRQQKSSRGFSGDELKSIAEKYATEAELDSLSLYKLLQVFGKVMQRLDEQKEAKHHVIHYPHTMREQKDYLLSRVRDNKQVTFKQVFEVCTTRIHAIFTFLSLLELVQLKKLFLDCGTGFNKFRIRKGINYHKKESDILADEQ